MPEPLDADLLERVRDLEHSRNRWRVLALGFAAALAAIILLNVAAGVYNYVRVRRVVEQAHQEMRRMEEERRVMEERDEYQKRAKEFRDQVREKPTLP
jgi:cytochrome c-type biogenesis protein CcmH/NrfG